MKRKFNSNPFTDSLKIQSFLERCNGSVHDQDFFCKYLRLKLLIEHCNIDLSFFNDSICIRYDDYLGNYCLKNILRLFPYESFAHIIYTNATYCISKIV